MDLRCAEVLELLASRGAAPPLSDERADLVAKHLDQCPECDRRLSGRVAEAVEAIPVSKGASLPAVRRLMQEAQRKSVALRIAAMAAAMLALLSTGWGLLRQNSAAAPASRTSADRVPPPSSVKLPVPDPPKLAELKAL